MTSLSTFGLLSRNKVIKLIKKAFHCGAPFLLYLHDDEVYLIMGKKNRQITFYERPVSGISSPRNDGNSGRAVRKVF